ncbi:MAG: ACT domain-containing protein [Anaerolineae bacterium]|nr:ACT domain-containing protein [Anaerolineae bacterium]
MEEIESTEEAPKLRLTILPGRLAICQLERDAEIPSWVWTGEICSVTRTPHELSIICAEDSVPEGVECEKGWRAISSEGPLGFTLTGLINALAEPLAVAGISIFALSTYFTDYVLVKENELQVAVLALKKAGHEVIG